MASDSTTASDHATHVAVLVHDAVRCDGVVPISTASEILFHAVYGTAPWHSNQEKQQAPAPPAVCIISSPDAISIFVAKQKNRNKRDGLATNLATEHGITAKAVRDIWNLRTWTWATRPYWTAFDTEHFERKRLNKTPRPPSLVNFTPATPDEVDIEPTPSREVVASQAVDIAEGDNDPQGLQIEQEVDEPPEEDSMLPESNDPQDTGVASWTAEAVDWPTPTRHQEQARSSAPHLPFDTFQWLIDSAFVAQEFEEISLAWHHSNTRRGYMGK